jgi:hypothetical protein
MPLPLARFLHGKRGAYGQMTDITVNTTPETDAARHKQRPRWLAPLVAVLLALIAAAASLYRSEMIDPVVLHHYGYGEDDTSGPNASNLMFDADMPKITYIMTDRFSNRHAYTSEHPLISLAMFTPVKALRVLGLHEVDAIYLVVAAMCAVWTGLLFSLLLLWGCRVLDAAIFTILAHTSAAAIFWFSVPEVFTFGSATILAAMILTMWPRNVPPVIRDTIGTALTLSMTLTNSMVGLLNAAMRLSLRHIWIVAASALMIVTALWGLQKYIFPEAQFFFPPRSGWVSNYLFAPTPMRIVEVILGFFSDTIVMPRIEVLKASELPLPGLGDQMMTVQRSLPLTTGLVGALATLSWLALLGLGVWAAYKTRPRLATLCGLIAVGQLALHTVFGSQTFLYTMHFLPLLIVVAACATFTKHRNAALALACIVSVTAGMNNWAEFRGAASVVHEVSDRAKAYPGATYLDWADGH